MRRRCSDAAASASPGSTTERRRRRRPYSSVAGLTGQKGAALTGRICPLSGSAEGLSDPAIEQTDDRSGGLTETEVADIAHTSPVDGETLYGRFTARAQAAFLGSDNAIIPSPYPVALTITTANGTKPVGTVSDVNTASGTPIKRLRPGTYQAIWTWHDFTGDSRTIVTSFVEEPAIRSSRAGSAPAKAKISRTLTPNPTVCDGCDGPVSRAPTVSTRLAHDPEIAGLGRTWRRTRPARLGGARGPGRRGP